MSLIPHKIGTAVELATGPQAAEAAALCYDAILGALHQALGPYRVDARHLRSLRNRYLNERCFIIGNGPSLRLTDLTRLRTEYTFGLNRIYLRFEELGFATSFLVCVNSLVWEQFGNDLMRQPAMTFAPWRERERFPETSSDAYFFRTNPRPVFRRNLPRDGVYEGGTVTFVAMQLARYLGFRQVVLIGVDHSFSATGPANTTVVSTGPDADHFDPSYFGTGVRWQLPDLESSTHAYQLAREAFAEDGREIIDATIGGKLDVFPKVGYDDVTSTSRSDTPPT